MFTMVINRHISSYGNPFCGYYSPKMNFLFGMAAGFARMSYMPMMYSMYRPMMCCCNRPLFTPSYYQSYTQSYTQSYSSNPFGGYYNQYSYQTTGFSGYGSGSYNYSSSSVLSQTPSFGNMIAYAQSYSRSIAAATPSTSASATSSSSSSSSSGSSSSGYVDTGIPATDGTVLNRHGSDYGPQFLAKVKEISQRLNCNYRDLLAIMNSESGISSTAQNKNGGATGLIQFMPSTAASLGTSAWALKSMSPMKQLDYVENYIMKAKTSAGFGVTEPLSGGQLYALIFLPGRAKRSVLTSSGEKYYSCNKGLDLNNDGQISIADLDSRVRSKYVSDKSFVA